MLQHNTAHFSLLSDIDIVLFGGFVLTWIYNLQAVDFMIEK